MCCSGHHPNSSLGRLRHIGRLLYDGLGSVGVEAMFNPGLSEYIYEEIKDRKDGARFVINTVKQMVSKSIAREKAKEAFQKVTSTIENGSIVFEYK